jgi:hypothetical protein
MTTSEAWERVGHAVRNQRLHLGWTQQDAAEHAGVSLATWRLIEAAGRDRYQDLTMRGVCRAFQWPNDTFATLLAGGDPPPLVDESQLTPPPTPAAAGSTAGAGTEAGGRDASLPAGFARKYLSLSHREQAMLEGYLEALIDRRTRP